MVHFETETTIDRPIEDVFARLIDIDAYPRWLPRSRVFVTCRQTSAGRVELGTTYEDRTRFGLARGEVVDLRSPTRVVFHYRLRSLGLPMMEGNPGYELEEVDGRTRLRHVADGELKGAFKVMEPLVRRLASYERGRTVRELKRSLESAPRVQAARTGPLGEATP